MLTLHPEEQVWLDGYSQALKREHADAVLRLVIYGSKARGDAHGESDIDLLLIVRDEAADLMRPLRRLGYTMAATSAMAPSIQAYTEGEWESLRGLRSPYRAAVEREGVTVL